MYFLLKGGLSFSHFSGMEFFESLDFQISQQHLFREVRPDGDAVCSLDITVGEEQLLLGFGNSDIGIVAMASLYSTEDRNRFLGVPLLEVLNHTLPPCLWRCCCALVYLHGSCWERIVGRGNPNEAKLLSKAELSPLSESKVRLSQWLSRWKEKKPYPTSRNHESVRSFIIFQTKRSVLCPHGIPFTSTILPQGRPFQFRSQHHAMLWWAIMQQQLQPWTWRYIDP